MAFAPSTIISKLPKQSLEKYFQKYPLPFLQVINWDEKEKKIHSIIKKAIKNMNYTDTENFDLHFERIAHLASEEGIRDMINAFSPPSDLEAIFSEQLKNDFDRSLYCFLEHPEIFEKAEQLLLVDRKSGGPEWRHCSIETKIDELLEIKEDDLDGFALSVAKVFYKNFNDTNACCAEIYQRHQEGTIQISVYVNGRPDSALMVDDKVLQRIDSKTATVSAVIIDPKSFSYCCTARGGKGNHDLIQKAFAKNILKDEDAVFHLTKKKHFELDVFSKRPKTDDILFQN